MGFDIAAATVRVLSDGLAPLPERLERRQTIPIALWAGDRHGAVLFVRLWSDGTVDTDCAIAVRAADGSWDEPDSWGGSAWIDDPFVRRPNGWDGDQVIWMGSHGHMIGSLDDEDELELPMDDMQEMVILEIPSDMPEAERQKLVEDHHAAIDAAFSDDLESSDIRVLVGAASAHVAAIAVERDGRSWKVPIESPCGAFIVGIEGPGAATLQPLDAHGDPVGASRRG